MFSFLHLNPTTSLSRSLFTIKGTETIRKPSSHFGLKNKPSQLLFVEDKLTKNKRFFFPETNVAHFLCVRGKLPDPVTRHRRVHVRVRPDALLPFLSADAIPPLARQDSAQRPRGAGAAAAEQGGAVVALVRGINA